MAAGVERSSSHLAALLAVALLVALGAALEAWWRRVRERTAARAAVRRGLRGERGAEKLLRKLGYTLLARQAPAGYAVLLDGEAKAVPLSADFLVEHKGRKLVAEVKTGKAVSLDHADTRRQLLEYQLAFGADALLLIDMEAKRVHTVRFPLPKSSSTATRRSVLRWAAVALIGGAAVWLISRGEEAHERGAKAAEASPGAVHGSPHAARKPGRL